MKNNEIFRVELGECKALDVIFNDSLFELFNNKEELYNLVRSVNLDKSIIDFGNALIELAKRGV